MKNNYYGIGLNNPKYMVNVGKVLRAAHIYNAEFVVLTGKRYKRTSTDTMDYHIYKPVFNVDNLHTMIPFDCIPVAVDKVDGAMPLPTYKHPKRAFYIFGAEDNTLGKRILSWCRDIVYIPMNDCMNLGAAVNVVLYDRMAKNFKGD